jgi:hypothetical protein
LSRGYKIPWSHSKNPLLKRAIFCAIFVAWTKKKSAENAGKPRFSEGICGHRKFGHLPLTTGQISFELQIVTDKDRS